MANNNRFIRIAGGFFRDTPEGLAAVNDPQNIRNLQSGQLPFETREDIEGINFSQDVSQPTLTPTAPTGRTDAFLPGNTAGSTTGAAENPFDNFNLLLLDAMKKAQGVGTADLLKRKRALERASLGRAEEITPEARRTLSPSQQSAIRSGKISAIRPEIDEAAFQLEKAQQSIKNFESVFLQAQKLGGEFAEKMVVPDSVVEAYTMAIEANPDNLSTLLSSLNDKSKQKVIENLDFSKLEKKDELEERKTFREDIGGRVVLFDAQTGKKIRDLGPTDEVPPIGDLGISPEAEAVLRNPSLLEEFTRTERGKLITEIARGGLEVQTAGQESASRMVANALTTLQQLNDIKGLFFRSGVGEATGLSRFNPFNLLPGSAKRQAEAFLETLKAQLTLPNLEFARGLGRMSIEQFRTLKDASQTLDFKALSGDAFVMELERVEETLISIQAQMQGRGAVPSSTEDSYQRYLESIR